ncbi:hypothetical protein BCR43DRAFT_505057 [Syncephalastrum racemosum]|uniref:Uncharacterized protein n=1 Tax=Syncephalastrum racemosum TaxID=13706 RepID=A0A1X2HBF8_SYNRA|nr:hypothetical protein BCR43DRAFT_505057 [Syncephalastrum racemosum]
MYRTSLLWLSMVLLAGYSQQQDQTKAQDRKNTCLATAINRGFHPDFTFAIAEGESPQAACYEGCDGAQILTASRNKDSMKSLTALDTSFDFLKQVEFITEGEAYRVNHLGLDDKHGGNGLGCFSVKSGGSIAHHPMSDSACKQTKKTVCGFWQQGGADKTPATSAPVPATAVEGPDTLAGETSPTVAAPPDGSASGDGPFRLEKGHGPFAAVKDAEQVCGTKGLASITLENMQAVKQLIAAPSSSSTDTSATVVGKWNNDDYGMKGSICLLISRKDGAIYSGLCSSASQALCQS